MGSVGVAHVFPPTYHGRPDYLPKDPKIIRSAASLDTTKHSFFLTHRKVAQDGLAGDLPDEFAEFSPLMKELRMVFDWICQEKGCMKIANRDFKARLPALHKKFPQISANFLRMDSNSDCWLEWGEFVNFCVQDDRLYKMLRRAATITVFGREHNGSLTYKDFLDPAHSCEMSPSPPILPWETAHVVEWRLDDLSLNMQQMRGTFGGTPLVPGGSIASPPFRAGGVVGFIRFWPLGYWTEGRRRQKLSSIPMTDEIIAEGCQGPPSAGSWCCIGAFLPAGTHLDVKFYVGDMISQTREVFWADGTHVLQLWAPPAKKPPASLTTPGNKAPFIIGIEILRNLATQNHMKPVPKKMHEKHRLEIRPHLREPPGEDPRKVGGSVLLGRAKSLPALKAQARPASPSSAAPGWGPARAAGGSATAGWSPAKQDSAGAAGFGSSRLDASSVASAGRSQATLRKVGYSASDLDN